MVRALWLSRIGRIVGLAIDLWRKQSICTWTTDTSGISIRLDQWNSVFDIECLIFQTREFNVVVACFLLTSTFKGIWFDLPSSEIFLRLSLSLCIWFVVLPDILEAENDQIQSLILERKVNSMFRFLYFFFFFFLINEQ